MANDCIATKPEMDTLFKVKLQIYAEYDLDNQHHREGRSERGMYVRGELPPFMSMTEEVAGN